MTGSVLLILIVWNKKYAATTDAHSKNIMGLLQNRKVLITNKHTIYENTYGCKYQCRYATALYLLSMFHHKYNIVMNCGVEVPVHSKHY